ncbi:hypothetical protein PsorP6_005139 [Peronosclerospora sorghi]|uniref:Uncharacterized protein n=1 Tax=Peronosclerospora sorghi TaxID=230839 RepID=A0ACC0W462_9STRA|nr:hypothetical protein PsorP6_005139 [Peronosclerospora sorghi]
MKNSSSSRKWYSLIDDESQSKGKLQLSLDFDVSAAPNELLPQKGDIVRLTGCGADDHRGHIVRAFTTAERSTVDYDDHAKNEMTMHCDDDFGSYEEKHDDEDDSTVPEQLLCPITVFLDP